MRFLEGQALGAGQLNSIAREQDRRRDISLNGAIAGQDSPVTGLALSSDSGQFWAKVLATVPAPSSGERGHLYVGEVIPDEKGTWAQVGGSYTAASGTHVLNGKGREGRAYPVNWQSSVPDGSIGLVFPGADGEWLFLTSSGAGVVPVRATQANAGTGWTTGTLLAYGPAGELVTPTPAETVELQPLQGTLSSNEVYLAVETGAREPATGRRRLRVERAGGGTTFTVYRYTCSPSGGLVETPITVTL